MLRPKGYSHIALKYHSSVGQELVLYLRMCSYAPAGKP